MWGKSERKQQIVLITKNWDIYDATNTDQRAEVKDFVFVVLWKQGEATEGHESGHLSTLYYKGGCFLCIRPESTCRGRVEIV